MLVDKSLPALPPNAIPQSTFSPGKDSFADTDTPTELSPRPRQPHSNNVSRSSSRRTRSPDRSMEGNGLTLPSSTYRKNRHSTISDAGDGDFFIPVALDPSPMIGPSASTPRSVEEAWSEASKSENKENKDYFGVKPPGCGQNKGSGSRNGLWDQDKMPQAISPHIAFQEKGRQLSIDFVPSPRANDTQRKGSFTSFDDTSVQHANSSSKSNNTPNGKAQSSTDKFRLQEVPKGKKSGTSRSGSYSESSTGSEYSPGALPNQTPSQRRDQNASAMDSPKMHGSIERNGTSRSSFDSRVDSRHSVDSPISTRPVRGDSSSSKITRKEVPKPPVPSSSGFDSSSSQSPSSSSDTTSVTPMVNGKSISRPLLGAQSSPTNDEPVPPRRSLGRPPPPPAQSSDTFMVPRAPPAPPLSNQKAKDDSMTGTQHEKPASPKLPRWSAGGDFTMDEDMARILGTDESSQSILRRVSNAVRHGRSSSEQSIHQRHGRSASEAARTTASPRWPRTPIAEDGNDSIGKDISSPISMKSPTSADDPSMLRRQLRNSEQRVSELERRIGNDKDLKNLNQKLIEKRKTVSVLDSQAEIMIRQLEVLAGYVEKAKDTKQPLNLAELEDSAIKEFVQKLEKLKQSMAGAVEQLYEERDGLMEEKAQAIVDRDRALVEFEQLSSKNAQLADMNNDLTHQIQERFKAQSGNMTESPRNALNSLGIYTHHQKDKSSTSVNVDDGSTLGHRPSTSTTLYSAANTYPQPMEQDPSMEPVTVLSAPHVVNIRKGQAKKFNWKKGGQQVAKGVSKGFKGAFASSGERQQHPGQLDDSIGMPYNMTRDPSEFSSNISANSLPRSTSLDPSRQQGGGVAGGPGGGGGGAGGAYGAHGGFGLFKKNATMPPRQQSNGNMPVTSAEPPSVLFGSDLIERTEYERRQIPSVVTRCIEEVELRGMDVEGIYRKTGGSGQVKSIQEGFERTEDYDISDPDLDVTAVTSVLKQYFRKLPTPLLTFDIYDRVLESAGIEDDRERCDHLRQTFNSLPPKHRDCLEFLVFHLERVAARHKENLMTPKNLAVVFAPTIMRDHSLEREMTDMHAKNTAVQFVIENSHEIFGSS